MNGFSCVCVTGWDGDRCQFERNECTLQQCQNGATCTVSPQVVITSSFLESLGVITNICRIHGLISAYVYFQNCKEICTYALNNEGKN